MEKRIYVTYYCDIVISPLGTLIIETNLIDLWGVFHSILDDIVIRSYMSYSKGGPYISNTQIRLEQHRNL